MMIKSIIDFYKEHILCFRQMISLSISSTRRHYAGTSLGIFWSLYKDIIFLITYSFFMGFIYPSSTIDGVPRTVYLVTGMIAWFFISEVLGTGTQSILRNRRIFKSIKFPISIIPTYETLSIFYRRALTYAIGFIILGIYGYLGDIKIFTFLYYNIVMILLMIALNHVISGFVAISKDFKELYLALVRILIYFVPIFWSVGTYASSSSNEIIKYAIFSNPITYILNGFRESFQISDYNTFNYHIYFWCVLTLLFLLGAVIQSKLRDYYADFI